MTHLFEIESVKNLPGGVQFWEQPRPASREWMCRVDVSGRGAYLSWYEVVKRTNRGAWVELWRGGKRRFILNDSKKRFAHESREAAIASFIARKRRQIEILEEQLGRTKVVLAAMESRHDGS